jgi:ribosomal protein S18 acetylase RimI-like enzyme
MFRMTEGHIQIRQYRPEDLDPVHRLVVASAKHDSVDPASTLETIPTKEGLQALLETKDHKPNPNALVAIDTESGEVVGYGVIRWWQEEGDTFVYLHNGSVRPDHRRQGIGGVLLESMQARIQGIAASHPQEAPNFMVQTQAVPIEPRLSC